MVFIWGSSKQTPISSLFAFPKTLKFMVLFKINSKLWFSHKIMIDFEPSSGYFSIFWKCIIEMPTVDVTQWSGKGLISFEAFENWNHFSMKIWRTSPDINSKFKTIMWRHVILYIMIFNFSLFDIWKLKRSLYFVFCQGSLAISYCQQENSWKIATRYLHLRPLE